MMEPIGLQLPFHLFVNIPISQLSVRVCVCVWQVFNQPVTIMCPYEAWRDVAVMKDTTNKPAIYKHIRTFTWITCECTFKQFQHKPTYGHTHTHTHTHSPSPGMKGSMHRRGLFDVCWKSWSLSRWPHPLKEGNWNGDPLSELHFHWSLFWSATTYMQLTPGAMALRRVNWRQGGRTLYNTLNTQSSF